MGREAATPILDTTQRFAARTGLAAELAALNGRPAKEPIRIYAGLDTATSRPPKVRVSRPAMP